MARSPIWDVLAANAERSVIGSSRGFVVGNIAFKRVPHADVVGDENRVEPGFLRRAR